MTMIEKVARAICATCELSAPPLTEDAQRWVDDHWIDWEREARAALEALKEPTEGMMRAGAMVTVLANGMRITTWASNKWPDMINAALTEEGA